MRELDSAFDRIEKTVLPSIAAMLDALIDSAAGARPGVDAAAYAEALRVLAKEIDAARATLDAIAAGNKGDKPKRIRRLPSAA